MNGQSRYHFFQILTLLPMKSFLTGIMALMLFLSSPVVHANWWNPVFNITIETSTNGEDADEPTGPEIFLGFPVVWTYTVTNTGIATLHDIVVYDGELLEHSHDDDDSKERNHEGSSDGSHKKPHIHGNIVCKIEKLKRNESRTCTLEGTAVLGQYQTTGTAVVRGDNWWKRVRDEDKSHYIGTLGNPSIDLEKSTQGQDADIAPGPEIPVGDSVEWTFAVTNTGDVDLTNVVVTDEQVQPSPTAATTVCQIPLLSIGQSQNCTVTGTAIEGQYQNLGIVNAQGLGDSVVTDQDASHYTGDAANGLASLPAAVPSSGDAPLAVTFTPNSTTQNAIIRYEWDFEGDGTYDRSETVGRDQSFTYNTPGSYNATLRVTENTGEQATGTVLITVNNQPPVVSANASPSNGQIPLTVTFSATATDSDGIAQFEWDYDGDGTFDETTPTGTASNIYQTEGSFQANVRVTDTLGAATTLAIPTLEVNALPVGSPSVSLAVSATTGNAPLNVTLTATATDPDNGTIDQYEWDLDGDGTYDQTTTVASLSHSYTAVGTFYPRVRVTDSAGQTAVDANKVFVVPQVSLNRDLDTIDPLNGETTTISTTLGGDTEVSVIIEGRSGELIRTLVPFTMRVAGNYDDVWDGNNDAASVVTEGDYRAILLYRVDGVVNRLDLALTTGGQQSNPPRSRIPSSFSPLAGDPLDITFTLNQASEVTAFMGLFRVNTRLVTFMQRLPLGRGTHLITWNGENSDGQLIEPPPGDQFLFGIFAYTLPDNAIYVRSGVHVSSVSAIPSVFQPTQINPDGTPALSQIQLDLNRAGDVKLVINDTVTGASVAEFIHTNIVAGTNTITWDGRDNNGNFVAPGTYRLGVAGVDETGYQSITVYVLQRIFY